MVRYFDTFFQLIASGTVHEHKSLIDFKDSDHVDEHWAWRRDGSDTEMTFRLARAKKLLASAHTAE
jgi:hypothetical protein